MAMKEIFLGSLESLALITRSLENVALITRSSKKNMSAALFALIMKNSERRSFRAHFLKRERRSPRAHEIESGAQSATHMSAAH